MSRGFMLTINFEGKPRSTSCLSLPNGTTLLAKIGIKIISLTLKLTGTRYRLT